MSQNKYKQPPSPYAAQNPFRDRDYVPHAPPRFAEVRARLPGPVLPQFPEWVAMYWRAWELAVSHMRPPGAQSGLVSRFIDPMSNGRLRMWDCAFMVQFGLYGRRICPCISMLDNFYAKQHDDGFICREIDVETGEDFFYPFDPNSTGPNMLAWAEWRHYRLTGEEERLQQVFWPLLAYHEWMRANRTWQNGLYWATGMSSGMDNQPRVPDSNTHHRHWAWVDASMQAALNCDILEKMATQVGEAEIAQQMNQERMHLSEQINHVMWQEETQFYYDVGANGRFSRVKSIGAYWGLLAKDLAPENRRQAFVQHLRDNWSFNLPHRIPSQSADSEGYNHDTGNYWRGAVWSPTNFMVLNGLQMTGHHKLAHAIGRNHVENVSSVFLETGTFWENYAPETAAPGKPAKPDYIGATGLTPISILLEAVIGISVDWPQRRVTWNRYLQTEGGYGVRSYPLGQEGTMSLFGDANQVIVETDTPFTITIRDAAESLQVAIPAGETTLDLS